MLSLQKWLKLTVSLCAFAMAAFIFIAYQNMSNISPNNDRAFTMFSRLAGRNPTPAELSAMLNAIQSGDPVGAAHVATSDPGFINITARTFCAQMSTRALTPDAILNDFTATCMGIIRDNTPVTDFTTSNYYYRVDPKMVPPSLGVTVFDPDDPNNYPALYQATFQGATDVTDNHYGALTGIDFLFDLGASLTIRNQQNFGYIPNGGDFNHGSVSAIFPNPDTAGLITSTKFLLDEAIAGTNRRMVQYVFHDFLCADPVDFADNGLVSGGGDDSYVGQDVDRFPGGSHNVYETSCKACHGIIDGMRGAFAYNDVFIEANTWPTYYSTGAHTRDDGSIREVVEKYSRNNFVFPNGHETLDSSWINLATVGNNATRFGWRSPTSGVGVHSFGVMISKSQAFSKCMVQRVFNAVCGRPPTFDESTSLVTSEAAVLESNQYNLRTTFERIAATPACIEQEVNY